MRSCWLLMENSHRARPYDHEYPRLLALRQVQPRVESGGQRALLWGPGEESCWRGYEQVFWREVVSDMSVLRSDRVMRGGDKGEESEGRGGRRSDMYHRLLMGW